MLHSRHVGGICVFEHHACQPTESLLGASASMPRLRRFCREFTRSGTGAVLLLAAVVQPPAWATSRTEPTHVHVAALVDQGDFTGAQAQIDSALARPGLAENERTALEFERERMRRILLDFTLTADQAKARLRRDIPDLEDVEFAAWDAAGLLEHRVVDGRTLYFSRAPASLFRVRPAAAARRAVQTPFDDGPMEKANAHHREIIERATSSGRASVAPRHVRVTQSIIVDADAVPA